MVKVLSSILILYFSIAIAPASTLTVITKIAKEAGSHADGAVSAAGKTADAVPLPKPGHDTSPFAGLNSHSGADLMDRKYRLTEPIAKSRVDRDMYKKLRDSAIKGDTNAMISMSELTRKGLVVDFGEPYFSYWLFEAVRIGSQQASRQLKAVCADSKEQRAHDRTFDQKCSRI